MYRIWMTLFAALSTLGLSLRVLNAQSNQVPAQLPPVPALQKGAVGSGLPNPLDGRAMRVPAELDRLTSDTSNKEQTDNKKSVEEPEEPINSDYRSEEEYKADGKDMTARKLEYGERPIDNTRAFLRSQTPFVQPGKWQFDFGATYSVFESDLPFISGSTLTEVNATLRRIDAPVGFRYGLTERLQLFGSTVAGWQGTEVSDGFTEQTRNTNGIGDVLTGFNYLLREETKDCPAIIG